MASPKTTHEIVTLLGQGLSSSEIAKRLDVSPPVVWGIKAHWRMGRYGKESRENRTVTKVVSSEHAAILRHLAEGIDPFTGEILSAEHLIQHPEVAQALSLAIQALDPESREPEQQLPQNAGKSWTKEEEKALLEEFDAGTSIRDIAVGHGRKEGGITSRLARLGKIERAPTPPPVDACDPARMQEQVKKKWHLGTWTKEEKALIAEIWCDPSSSRDEHVIRILSDDTGRSPWAIIIRLYQEGIISIPDGDILCRSLHTPKMLSEANIVRHDTDITENVLEEESPPLDQAELANRPVPLDQESTAKELQAHQVGDCVGCESSRRTIRKQIVVLANSVKHDPGRCIAGREISAEDDDFGIGPWVRPVSPVGEGEVCPQHFTLEDGSTPNIFDVIEIYVDGPNTEVTQPENWIISENRKWKKVQKWDFKAAFDALVENPSNLWLQPDVKTDRITRQYLAANPPSQSLYLLELHNATISGSGRKYRLRFSHNGTNYDLAITDPLIKNLMGSESNVVVRSGIACVSLAPAFLNEYDGKEYHFKLAAMVMSNE